MAESHELMMVPVAEHPLFPGSTQALQLTENQYKVLLEEQ